MSCTYLPNASHPGDLENEEGGGRGCKAYWDKFGFLVLQTDILILVPNMVLVRWVRGGTESKVEEGGDVVYLQVIPGAVHQKPVQPCKAILLLLEINF